MSAINEGHPTEGDPVMEEYFEAKSEEIAAKVREAQRVVDEDPAATRLALDEGLDMSDLLDVEIDDGTGDAVDEESALTSTEELASRVRRLVELRAARDEKKVAADKAKEEFAQYQAAFFEEYRRSPLKGSIKVDVGGEHGTVQIVPRETKFGRILDKDKAREYFKSRGKEKEFIKEEFSKARLNELVREHIEQGKPLPDGVDFYTTQFFTITIKD